jgi:hypothetical protein
VSSRPVPSPARTDRPSARQPAAAALLARVLYLAPASTGGVELPASFVQVGVVPSGPQAKVAVCPQPSARYALPGNVVTVMESAGQLYSADIRSLTVPAFPTVHADARAADITTKPRTVITSPLSVASAARLIPTSYSTCSGWRFKLPGGKTTCRKRNSNARVLPAAR